MADGISPIIVPMDLDVSRWSGDGDFTRTVVDALQAVPEVEAIRVEDAPASRSAASYMFLSNEVYVRFGRRTRTDVRRWMGVLPVATSVTEAVMTLSTLHERLTGVEAIGEADYSDDEMLQYLRTQRIVPPYQTRGIKLVELVRIYVTS
jgi:hypothetical protein